MGVSIQDKNNDVLPKIERLEQMFSIVPEADRIAKNYKPLVEFGKHSDTILQGIKMPSMKHFAHISVLAFDFARMGDITKDVNETFKVIKQKDENSKKQDLAETKKSVQELIDMYLMFIDWVRSVQLYIDMKTLSENVHKFRGAYYG